MIRLFVTLVIVGATLGSPLMAFGAAKDSGQQPNSAGQSAAAQKFRGFLDADWQRLMEEYPEHATNVGYPDQNDRWTDDSPAGIARRKKHLADSLATLK